VKLNYYKTMVIASVALMAASAAFVAFAALLVPRGSNGGMIPQKHTLSNEEVPDISPLMSP
jgi:hypothetical protein